MKYLEISNKGELDSRLLSLVGGTTKDKDDFKIGTFGTGLKYAISYLIRNNIKFKLFIGENEVSIQTKTETISKTKFEVIYVNGERTSLTTKAGQDWKAWMIIRELWCNAIDEEDAVNRTTNETKGKSGRTSFFIQLTKEIKEVHDSWNSFFIHSQKPTQEHPNFKIYENNSKGISIYKKGVLIYRNETVKTAIFSYDLLNASINELREYKGLLEIDLPRVLTNLDRDNSEYFLNNLSKSFESELDYDYSWDKFSEEFTDALGGKSIIDEESYSNLVTQGKINEENKDSFIPLPKKLFNKINRSDGYNASHSAVDTIINENTFFRTESQEVLDYIYQRKCEIENFGYKFEPNLKTEIGVFLKDDTLIHLNKGVMMINETIQSKSVDKFKVELIKANEMFKNSIRVTDFEKQANHFIEMYFKSIAK